MKDWFYAKLVDGTQAVYSTAGIDRVFSVGVGILIYFKTEGSVRTDTYDLDGFVSNVLDQQSLLNDIEEDAHE